MKDQNSKLSKKTDLSQHAFLKNVKDTIKQNDMLHKGDRVLAAVSGGADSVCLLKVLLDIRRILGVEVVVANMDHCLRGKESERDSEFVKNLSEKLKVKFVHKKIKIKSRQKKGISLEECAREERYAFLKRCAERKNCNVIATGHTMDDQAETVLMRMIYGSSLAGITGIPPVRYEKHFKIIRPLIRIERRDILKFLKKAGLKFVEDRTNLDKKFIRNSIRHKVLPFLEKYNPRIKRSLANLSDSLREDFLFLNVERKKAIKKYKGGENKINAVKIKDIILQPKAIRKEIFKELLKRTGGNVKKLTYRHWMDMDYFLTSAERGKSLNFPGSVEVVKIKDEIVFSKRLKSG